MSEFLNADPLHVSRELTTEITALIRDRLRQYGYHHDAIAIPVTLDIALTLAKLILDAGEVHTPGLRARFHDIINERVQRELLS